MSVEQSPLLVDFLIILAGVVVTLGLGEVVIRNAIELAVHFRVTGTFIGLTVLSVGTSIPEIFTHVVGSVQIVGAPELMNTVSALVVGANIGSDIFQQNFVLPLVGLIGVVVVHKADLWSEVGALVGASVLLWLFALGGFISPLEGAILVLAYVAYLFYLAKRSRVTDSADRDFLKSRRRILIAVVLIALSFVIMAVVTEQVVGAATRLSERLPVSASLFGIVFLGVASALPELTTALISITKGEKGISAGVLIGSNVTNPLLALGLGAVISGYAIPDVVVYYDLPVKIVTALAIFVFLWTREELERWEAWVLIALFVAYLAGRNVYFPIDF